MDKQNLMPQAAQPVNRSTTGQLPAELAELSEEALQQHFGHAEAAAVYAAAVSASTTAEDIFRAVAMAKGSGDWHTGWGH